MDPDTRIDARLTELEIKASFTDDTVEQLNQIIIRQQAQIELLMREVMDLKQQGSAAGPTFRSLRDELPPHY
ncbi:SlyX family protein [Pelomonas sp. KK5]|uniref:SlyX family protein n=1 Tax=Pelomonas sp. KK5 TaxID=1855730 RepID=UPI00097BC352|nr:SlyX family protein [Pelomonas sp. KK5]